MAKTLEDVILIVQIDLVKGESLVDVKDTLVPFNR